MKDRGGNLRVDFVFVDAENVSGKSIENISAGIGKEVFIFSKMLKIAELSKERGFTCINDYPKGTNQADFSIIGLLCRKIAEYQKHPSANLSFTLYSHDKSLIEAFKNQCRISSMKVKIISPNPNPTSRKNMSVEDRILLALRTPKKLNNDLWAQLQLTQAEFTRTVSELIKSGMIFRSSNRKKYWIAKQNAQCTK